MYASIVSVNCWISDLELLYHDVNCEATKSDAVLQTSGLSLKYSEHTVDLCLSLEDYLLVDC